jgi:glutathione synthase/RimK-type ligase-like ATP-grasp enzyme
MKGEYDLRIQKIGNHYRAYRRIGGGGWKTNQGSAILEDVPMTEQYKLWVDECAKLFGGMEILAVDAIHNADDGKDYILEVNDSSIGLGPQHEDEGTLACISL